MTVYFDGYTAKTPLGPVDMVPLLRRMQGDRSAPINEFERNAAVLALQATGMALKDVALILGISFTTACEIAAGKSKRVKPITQSRSDKYDRDRAKVLQRHAERKRVDGRWVHPDCEHGKDASYRHFGCRCVPCSEAHTVVRRKSYPKQEATA